MFAVCAIYIRNYTLFLFALLSQINVRIFVRIGKFNTQIVFFFVCEFFAIYVCVCSSKCEAQKWNEQETHETVSLVL